MLRIALLLLLCAVCQTTAFAAQDPVAPCWKFPQLRTVYRDAFQWSRTAREEGSTSGTVALIMLGQGKTPAHAMAALMVCAEIGTTPTLSLARQEQLRREAFDLSKDASIQWGPQALWNAALNPAVHDPAALPEFLLDQFGDDKIPMNSRNAPEIYLVGLQEDPARFLPPLVARVEGLIKAGNQYDQQTERLSNLLLVYAAFNAKQFNAERDSYYYLAYGEFDGDAGNLNQMRRRERDVVLDVAAAHACMMDLYNSEEQDSRISVGNRRMAWLILEQADPLPYDQFKTICANPGSNNRERTHVLTRWILRDPQTLLLYPKVYLSQFQGQERYPRDSQLLSVQTRSALDDEEIASILADVFSSRYRYAAPADMVHAWPYVERFRQIIRDNITQESDAFTQLCMARVLLTVNDTESRDLIAEILVSQLADDDDYNNANSAQFMLEELGDDSVDSLYAGLVTGAKINDWQLISRCDQMLSWMDAAYRAGDFPDAMDVMAMQLFDDNVENNAVASRRYLIDCGEAARPLVQQIAEEGDDQAKYNAKLILGWLDVKTDADLEGDEPYRVVQ